MVGNKTETPEKSVDGYKWRALVLLWVAFFLQQGTRQIYGATLSSIQNSLGLDPSGIGLVGTVFTFLYGIAVPFAGMAADFFLEKGLTRAAYFSTQFHRLQKLRSPLL